MLVIVSSDLLAQLAHRLYLGGDVTLINDEADVHSENIPKCTVCSRIPLVHTALCLRMYGMKQSVPYEAEQSLDISGDEELGHVSD